MERIKTIICDDVVELCDNYKKYMEITDKFVCVGVAHNAKQCVEAVKICEVDLLLLDIQMETEVSGIEIIKDLKMAKPNMIIIMLTSHDNSDYVFHAFLRGADRYVVKKSDICSMFEEIYHIYLQSVEKNSYNFDLNVLRDKARDVYNSKISILYLINAMSKLSTGEFDLLKELYMGKSYKDIAIERVVEETSVKSMASRVLKKLGAKRMKDVINELKSVGFFENLM